MKKRKENENNKMRKEAERWLTCVSLRQVQLSEKFVIPKKSNCTIDFVPLPSLLFIALSLFVYV